MSKTTLCRSPPSVHGSGCRISFARQCPFNGMPTTPRSCNRKTENGKQTHASRRFRELSQILGCKVNGHAVGWPVPYRSAAQPRRGCNMHRKHRDGPTFRIPKKRALSPAVATTAKPKPPPPAAPFEKGDCGRGHDGFQKIASQGCRRVRGPNSSVTAVHPSAEYHRS